MYNMNQAYNATDPSAQVPAQLLPHVHLISSYRFPTVASIQPQLALDYLLKGPAIVKDAAAVAWTYLQAPPADGTVLLTWQAPRMGTHFASDGMIWGDPEAAYDIPIKGFQLQVLVHKCGYQYPHEPVAAHARYRYRVANGPGAFDPNLWLVHYTMSDPNTRIPASQIPISREAHTQLQTRAQLQNAGQLMRKEFMLYDSQNWPKVEFTQPPPRGQQAYYNPMQRPQQSYANGAIGQPPAKRQRVPPQQQVRQPVQGVLPVDALEEEENTMQDSFDFMTPREISLSRYKQHHEWMEEIFSSPHTIGKIMPIDLGFGLMGELAPLTVDILDAPTGDAPIDINGDANPNYKNKVKNYEKLQPEQLKEFETRVSTYQSKEEAEIEKIKAAHTKKIAALKKSRTYIKAERRLRDAYHTVQTSEAEKDGADSADTVVKDLEKSLGVEFDSKKLVLCVEKGGFQEPQLPQPQKLQVNGNGDTPSNSNTGSNEGALDGENTAASLLDQFGSGSLTGTPAGNLSVPALSQPQSQAQSAVVTPSAPPGETAPTSAFDEQAANLDSANDGNDLLDLDVEMSGITNAVEKGGEADWVMVEGQNSTNVQQGTQLPASVSTPAADANALPTSGVGAEAGDMFSGADFGSFDNLDSAGEALADFPGDDTMGLDLVDDSAFGDAFHGMGNDVSGNDV